MKTMPFSFLVFALFHNVLTELHLVALVPSGHTTLFRRRNLVENRLTASTT